MRRLRRVVATVTTVAVLGLSAACGGDNPTPSTAPSASPSPSNSPSATPEPPSAPRLLKSKSRKGAEAGVRHFIDSLNYSGSTGDLGPLRNTYAPTCTRCEAIATSIDETYKAGGRYEGGQWKPTALKFYRIEGDVAVLDAVVDYSAQQWIRVGGQAPERFDASENNLHSFQLRFSGNDGWLVGALDPEQ